MSLTPRLRRGLTVIASTLMLAPQVSFANPELVITPKNQFNSNFGYDFEFLTDRDRNQLEQRGTLDISRIFRLRDGTKVSKILPLANGSGPLVLRSGDIDLGSYNVQSDNSMLYPFSVSTVFGQQFDEFNFASDHANGVNDVTVEAVAISGANIDLPFDHITEVRGTKEDFLIKVMESGFNRSMNFDSVFGPHCSEIEHLMTRPVQGAYLAAETNNRATSQIEILSRGQVVKSIVIPPKSTVLYQVNVEANDDKSRPFTISDFEIRMDRGVNIKMLGVSYNTDSRPWDDEDDNDIDEPVESPFIVREFTPSSRNGDDPFEVFFDGVSELEKISLRALEGAARILSIQVDGQELPNSRFSLREGQSQEIIVNKDASEIAINAVAPTGGLTSVSVRMHFPNGVPELIEYPEEDFPESTGYFCAAACANSNGGPSLKFMTTKEYPQNMNRLQMELDIKTAAQNANRCNYGAVLVGCEETYEGEEYYAYAGCYSESGRGPSLKFIDSATGKSEMQANILATKKVFNTQRCNSSVESTNEMVVTTSRHPGENLYCVAACKTSDGSASTRFTHGASGDSRAEAEFNALKGVQNAHSCNFGPTIVECSH